jgi:hypothetical protein
MFLRGWSHFRSGEQIPILMMSPKSSMDVSANNISLVVLIAHGTAVYCARYGATNT